MSMSHFINFKTPTTYISLPVPPGSVTLIAGPNGVGKSALLAALFRSLPQGVATYLPGHRQINFNNGWETAGQDAAQLMTNMFQHIDSFNRYKSAWAEDQFKTTLRRLLNLEAAYNREFRYHFSEGRYEEAVSGSIRLSPVDTLNLIFEGARLPVRFKLTGEGISAEREGSTYPIDAMSDGERAALFIVAAIVGQSDNTVVLIDEPEKHLHPSITGLLLDACIRARPEIAIVVSSHDVLLIERLKPTRVVHIKNSTVVHVKPETRVFDARVIDEIDRIPEDLRADLLGTRSEILFVEGGMGSSDLALYSHIYEGMKISPKGGYGKVQEAVNALRGLSEQHWLTPYGIIDGDGRSAIEYQTLAEKGIFALPCPSIENIFFSDELIRCFVDADSAYSGGEPLEKRLAVMAVRCMDIARRDRGEIIALRASWLLERRLSESKLSPLKLKLRPAESIKIDVDSLVNEVELEVDGAIGSGDWRRILQELPIKKTGLPNEAAKALGAASFQEYESVIIRQFDVLSAAGIQALSRVRERFPLLTYA